TRVPSATGRRGPPAGRGRPRRSTGGSSSCRFRSSSGTLSFSPPAHAEGDLRKLVEERAADRDVEDLLDHGGPAVDEVAPAVVHDEVARGALAVGLVQEAELPAVVQLPHERPL